MSYGIEAVHYDAFPGSFIGRQIAYFHVRFVDTNASTVGDPAFDYTNFRLAVQAIQTQAEILWTGTPWISNGYGAFMVALSYDTANDGNNLTGNTNSMAETIQSILRTVLDDGDVQFVRKWAVGSNWYDQGDYVDYVTNNGQFDHTTVNNVYGHGSVEQDELIILIG